MDKVLGLRVFANEQGKILDYDLGQIAARYYWCHSLRCWPIPTEAADCHLALLPHPPAERIYNTVAQRFAAAVPVQPVALVQTCR